jgi:hypothetical protein
MIYSFSGRKKHKIHDRVSLPPAMPKFGFCVEPKPGMDAINDMGALNVAVK